MRTPITTDDLAVAFRSVLMQCNAEYGIVTPVRRNFNPQKSGRIDTAIYYTLMESRNIGNASRRYDPLGDDANHVESTHYEQRILITCVSDDIDPQDLAERTRMVCGSLPFIERLRALHVGSQNPSGVRMLYFVDEHDNQALECSFDLTVSYNRAILPTTKTVKDYTLDTLPI